jgi:CO/xanthine dehydrogenase FAD-binding subunit
VKPPPLEYRRPASLEEALADLAEHGLEAKVLAGGQSLVPLLNLRLARPSVLVDVNRLEELDHVHAENGALHVGATVRQSALELERIPLLAECLPHVGHFVTRNRGTVGGSIAHADAAAELPLALTALGGAVVARSVRAERVIPAGDFFVSHFTTALEHDEIVTETRWPKVDAGTGAAFEELSLRQGDYALAMAACVLRVDDGAVAEARIAVGAVTDRPTLLERAAEALVGVAVDAESAGQAGASAAATVDPPGNLHAGPEYLRHVTGVLVERAVLRAWTDV